MGNGNDTQNNNTQINNTQNNNTQNNNTQNNNTRNSNPQGNGPGNNQNKKKGRLSGIGDGIRNGSAIRGFGKSALIALAAVIIFATVSGGFYRVDEQESAVVTMFGNVIRTDTAGLYFKIPWIQQVTKVDTTIHGTGIGYTVNEDGQSFTVDTEGIMITSDFNLIDIDFYMEYRVSDPVAYLFNSKSPEYILKNIALAAIRSTVIDFTVDDAMTTGKAQIQSLVKQKMQEQLTEQNIGLQVVNITVQDAEPPTDEIVREFKAVETAKQGKDTAINNANKYRNQQIPAAEANADKIVQSAEAGKAARIAEAEGQVARFNEMYEQYAVNPLITKQRLFYETMEEVLPGLKVIISDGDTQTMYPIESFSTITGSSAEAEGN
ncbi:MAG: FtsH protease activity modulator HflK [Lachnospiraceae bacterium]|nr:FtsH protease activity modulator HflK [Lachnospiraceae bacterium]